MSRKKVIFIAPPFKGHLHPLLGLAIAVREVADVLVMSTPSAQAETDLPFRTILAQQEDAVWRIAEPGQGVKNNPLLLWRQLRQNVALMGDMKHALDAALREEQPQLVIADFTVPVAGLAAAQQGIPWWSTLPSPCVLETRDGPPAYFGGQTPQGSPLLQAAVRRGTRLFKRLMFLLFRRQFRALGYTGIYRPDGSEAVYSPLRILALALPQLEFPCTWPPQLTFTGPVLHTPPCQATAPPFDQRPHVLVSLGTHLPHAKAAMAGRIRAIALRHPQLVFHFTHGRPDAGGTLVRSANYHELAYLSYAEHISRYALVVHHAGSGILHHCLHHGVPSVAHPQDFDQFDNAARLSSAGLAIIERNPEQLEAAMLRALTDGALRQRCQQMARISATYDAPATVREMVRGMVTESSGLPQ